MTTAKPPTLVTWLVSRDRGADCLVAQCCECDVVVQAKTLPELKQRAAALLKTTEFLRVTYRNGVPKPYAPALAKRTSGKYVACDLLGRIPIISRFKTPWPFDHGQKRGQWRVVNPDLYR